jgi:HEAT repeat protein
MRLLLTLLISALLTTGATAQRVEPPIDELLTEIKGDDPLTAAAAIRQIGPRKDVPSDVIRTLVERLGDTRRAVSIEGPVTFYPETVGDVAAEALSAIGKPAVAPLAEFLTEETDTFARRRAMQALGQMEAAAAEAIPAIESMLRHKESQTRLDAIVALVSIEKAPAKLAATLATRLGDESPDVRAAAVRALGELGASASSAVPRLVELLGDKAMRWQAISPDMLHQVPVRYDAAMALAEVGDAARVALPKLRQMMAEDSELTVRIAAAYAVVRLDDKTHDAALDFLIGALLDWDQGTWAPQEAAQALGKLGPRASRAIPALTKALEHRETMVRIYALEAIASVDPEAAEPLLIRMMQDEDVLVRSSAIEAITDLPAPSPERLPALIAALDDTDDLFPEYVRYLAVVAIGKLGKQGEPALEKLKQLAANDEDERVRESAKEAIREIERDQ